MCIVLKNERDHTVDLSIDGVRYICIKTYFTQIGCAGLNYIQLVQDRNFFDKGSGHSGDLLRVE